MNKLGQFSLTAFQAAAERIRPYVAETPIVFDAGLNATLKYEHQQPTRSFKVRGAFNKILQMPPALLERGVVTGSAGNHGQAVALACQTRQVPVTVFIPEKTPQVKAQRMQKLGARVVRVAGLFGEAEAQAIQFALQNDLTFISAYNDPDIILGAGAIALEWLSQAPGLERLIIPVGGGGLICGVGLAAKALKPEIEVIGVLSEASPYLYYQYYTGSMENVWEMPTLTDGLAGAVEPGSITVDLLPHACDGIVQLTEKEVAQGIAYAQHKHAETIEGSGAVGISALLADKIDSRSKTTGALLSGGNIDPARHQEISAAWA